MRLLVFFITLIPHFIMAQTVCTQASREELDSTLIELSKMDAEQKSINEVVLEIGTSFLNTPYVEKTLEIEGDEKLVIDLERFDCTTFLETVITLARMTKLEQLSYDDYERELELLRYRNGLKEEYPSRLHYFSDWIFENQQKGILSNVTEAIGGQIYENKPSFMSENPKFYAQLSDEDYVEQIKDTESEIRQRRYHYLPKESVEKLEHKIKPGDIIAITISMDNLDISHVGFAIEHKGRIHLLHAGSNSKKVEISEKPLSDYLKSHKSQSGIMVCRLNDPGI